MALKRFVATVSTANTEETIHISSTSPYGVETGYELAVVGTRLSGGTNGGDLSLLLYRNNTKVSEIKFSLAANDVVMIDSKDFYEAGDVLKIEGSAAGLSVELSADYSATA